MSRRQIAFRCPQIGLSIERVADPQAGLLTCNPVGGFFIGRMALIHVSLKEAAGVAPLPMADVFPERRSTSWIR